MARKLRLEYPGATYHVINRGNYRRWIFETDSAKAAFEACLFEACEKSAWMLHAYVVMGNHYHLALETPKGNLVAGMHWLQVTFATRFNRFRDERGHLFQGRYKALLVEPGDALGLVCHYIHLNPVRARIVPVSELLRYRYSSYRFFSRGARPNFLDLTPALDAVGGLSDTAAGWRCYADFLDWQSAEGPAGRSRAYVNLSRGWALGTAEFKARLIRDHGLVAETRAWERLGAAEVRHQHWMSLLQLGLKTIGKTLPTARAAAKSSPWKLAPAAWLKGRTQVKNRWLTETLGLGAITAVSRNVGRFCRFLRARDPTWKKLKSISST